MHWVLEIHSWTYFFLGEKKFFPVSRLTWFISIFLPRQMSKEGDMNDIRIRELSRNTMSSPIAFTFCDYWVRVLDSETRLCSIKVHRNQSPSSPPSSFAVFDISTPWPLEPMNLKRDFADLQMWLKWRFWGKNFSWIILKIRDNPGVHERETGSLS